MKKKIIVFVLSILLSVIGICATVVYVVELWNRKPVPAENGLFSGITSGINAIVGFGIGYIAIVFTGTALILAIYCIKNCKGAMRSVSIALCVLCALAVASSVISYIFYFIISINLTELRIPVRFL